MATARRSSAPHGEHPPRIRPRIPAAAALEATARLFAALADPERLRLLAALSAGERCVGELTDDERKLTTVSARLKTLHAARLVQRRREARHIFYSLADAHVVELLQSALAHATERNRPKS